MNNTYMCSLSEFCFYCRLVYYILINRQHDHHVMTLNLCGFEELRLTRASHPEID